MKNTPNELFNKLTKKFSPKIEKELINEELGQIVTLKPLVNLTSEDFNPNKQAWETKFENFVNEERAKSLEPIVNDDMKTNTLEKENKIKADPKLKFEMDTKLGGSYKVSSEVENIASHNYDYNPKVENINNVNAQELLSGVQLEINYNKELTLDEAMELATKNLAKNPLHYVEEGQFGVKGVGYTEGKQQQSDGETYGGSGFSTKLKDGGDSFTPVKESKDSLKELVKESLGQVMTTGNPNSYAAQSGAIINQMMAEKEEAKLPMDETEDEGTAVSYSEAREKAVEASQDKAGMEEEARPDYADIDGDGDKEETMKKAASDKKKKPKKETIDSKLAEIGKQGDVVKMEAQINFLDEVIEEKANRLSSIAEDENLSELVDKKKMKDMQKEVKLLEKKKAQMEKVYEKMCGKAYKKMEVVGEMDTNESSEE